MTDPAPQTQALNPADEAQMNALIARHRGEIDEVLGIIDPREQLRKVAEYGFSPEQLSAHYRPLWEKEEALKQKNREVEVKATWTGWATAGITGLALGSLALFSKKMSESVLIKGLMVTLPTITMGILGNTLSYRALSGRLRDESRDVTLAARNALETELAIAMENRDRAKPAPIAPVPAAAAPAVPAAPAAPTALMAQVAPRESFTEEALKARAAAAQTAAAL